MPTEQLKFEEIYLDVVNYNKSINKKYIRLINGFSGYFESGKINVIMGGSGSSKSKFMETLIGKVKNDSKSSGRITVADSEREHLSWLTSIAYLEQEDHFFPNLTVEETIQFSLSLNTKRTLERCSDVPRKKFEAAVKSIKTESNISNDLGKCASNSSTVEKHLDQKEPEESVALNEILRDLELNHIRGTLMSCISGGEAKRTLIAAELIMGKKIIFMDEPTTGLDTHISLKLLTILKQYALQDNIMIIMTIHQPTDTMFRLFDNITFISQGFVVYSGLASAIESFFSSKNIVRKRNMSMSEFLGRLGASIYLQKYFIRDSETAPFDHEVQAPSSDTETSEIEAIRLLANQRQLQTSLIMGEVVPPTKSDNVSPTCNLGSITESHCPKQPDSINIATNLPKTLHFQSNETFSAHGVVIRKVWTLIKRQMIIDWRTKYLQFGFFCKLLMSLLVIFLQFQDFLTNLSKQIIQINGELGDSAPENTNTEFIRASYAFFSLYVVGYLLPLATIPESSFLSHQRIYRKEIFFCKYSPLTIYVAVFIYEIILSALRNLMVFFIFNFFLYPFGCELNIFCYFTLFPASVNLFNIFIQLLTDSSQMQSVFRLSILLYSSLLRPPSLSHCLERLNSHYSVFRYVYNITFVFLFAPFIFIDILLITSIDTSKLNNAEIRGLSNLLNHFLGHLADSDGLVDFSTLEKKLLLFNRIRLYNTTTIALIVTSTVIVIVLSILFIFERFQPQIRLQLEQNKETKSKD